MSNIITQFNFQSTHQVRIALDNQGDPLFCLTDVAKVLNIPRSSDLLQVEKPDFVKNETSSNRGTLDPKGVYKIYISFDSGKKQLNFINEPNLYRVIFRSNKKEARAFQDWVFNEVLPSIRKTGSYHHLAAHKKASSKDLHEIADKINMISHCFFKRQSASNEIYNRLRVSLRLSNIADIAEHQLKQAHDILDEIHAHAKAYEKFKIDIESRAQSSIIRQGRPYTPHLKRQLGKLGVQIGQYPDWQALAQLL